jgi:hypothetical protein
MMAVASWLGSTMATQASLLNAVSISTCSPSVGRSNFAVSRISMLMSVSRGCSGCRRAKASKCWVRSAPRAAASSIILVIAASRGSFPTASARISIVPVMTVRMLLKSWAKPPVSWPTASIFSDCRMRSSAAILSERSRAKPLNSTPVRVRIAVTLSSARNSLPSRRRTRISRRRPRICSCPERRKRPNAAFNSLWSSPTTTRSITSLPSASSRVQPNSFSACEFHMRIAPLSSI